MNDPISRAAVLKALEGLKSQHDDNELAASVNGSQHASTVFNAMSDATDLALQAIRSIPSSTEGELVAWRQDFGDGNGWRYTDYDAEAEKLFTHVWPPREPLYTHPRKD